MKLDVKNYINDFNFEHVRLYTRAKLTVDGVTFRATAKCHPKDVSFNSSKTGEIIAASRVWIKVLDSKIEDLIKEVNCFKTCLNMYDQIEDKNFSAMGTALQRQIEKRERAIKYLRLQKKKTNKELTEYIHQKDQFYKQVRARRRINKKNKSKQEK